MMKRIAILAWFALAISQCFYSGCGRNDNMGSQSQDSSNPSRESETYASNEDRQKAMDAVAEQYWKETLERNRTGRGLKIEKPPLPNYICGPGRPRPAYINFYEIHDNYPAYLLCTFKVNAQHYNPSNEPAWFEDALLQIRKFGPEKFRPTLKWVAVIIANSAEHKGVTTFEQSRKVGAIFNLKDVFDPSLVLSKLVTQARMDRHPFVYDPKPVIPWKQDRWMIVERHAASAK